MLKKMPDTMPEHHYSGPTINATGRTHCHMDGI